MNYKEMKDTIKFHLSKNQLLAIDEWKEARNPTAYSGAIGGRYAYCFLMPCVGKQVSYVVDDMGDINGRRLVLTDLFGEPKEGLCEFELDEMETRECREWIAKRLLDGIESNGRFEVSFAFTSLGGVTKIKDLVNTSGESELDVTDYDW